MNFVGKENVQVIDLPIVDIVSPRPAWVPLAMPRDLMPRIARINGNPIAWWAGQFFRLLLRPQSSTLKMFEDTSKKLGFQTPIVGSAYMFLSVAKIAQMKKSQTNNNIKSTRKIYSK